MTYEFPRTYDLYPIAYPQNLQFNKSSVTSVSVPYEFHLTTYLCV